MANTEWYTETHALCNGPCGEWKKLKEFYARKDGFAPVWRRCKECKKATRGSTRRLTEHALALGEGAGVSGILPRSQRLANGELPVSRIKRQRGQTHCINGQECRMARLDRERGFPAQPQKLRRDHDLAECDSCIKEDVENSIRVEQEKKRRQEEKENNARIRYENRMRLARERATMVQ